MIAITIVSMIISLPFKIYSTFVIEEKYGFNKTTAKTFICDQFKSFFIGVVFTIILIPLILWVVDVAGDKLVVSLVSVSFVLILVL